MSETSDRRRPAVLRMAGRLDRRAGAAVRRAVAALPGGRAVARIASGALGPAFRGLVALMILRRPTRRAGIEALLAAAGASLAARALRDRLGRPRPGARADGGFPSRHAAAAVAIARVAGRRHPRLRAPLAGAAALGLTGRVAAAQHEPGDLLAGALMGLAAEVVVEAAAGEPLT